MLYVHLAVRLSAYRPLCLSVRLSVCLHRCLSVCLPACALDVRLDYKNQVARQLVSFLFRQLLPVSAR